MTGWQDMSTAPRDGFTLAVCVVVHCRTCKKGFEYEDGEGTIHFDTVTAAEAAVAEHDDWWLTQAGPQCVDCAGRESCTANGHAWEPWKTCRCDGRIPRHTVQMESRFCASCPEYEERPLAEAPGGRPLGGTP